MALRLGLICPLLQLLWDRSFFSLCLASYTRLSGGPSTSFLFLPYFHFVLRLKIFHTCQARLLPVISYPKDSTQASCCYTMPRKLSSSSIMTLLPREAHTSKLLCCCSVSVFLDLTLDQVRAGLCGPNTTIPTGVQVTSYYSSAISCACMLLLDLFFASYITSSYFYAYI